MSVSSVQVFVVGDSGVGKSCLLLRYVEHTFESSFLSTIGLDYKSIPLVLEGEEVICQLWDTAGQERFLSITLGQYRDADCIVVVFDLTDELSFDHLDRWLSQIVDHADGDVPVVVVGNKVDLEHKRVIGKTRCLNRLSEGISGYYECSAKTGVQVKTAFDHAATLAWSRKKQTRAALLERVSCDAASDVGTTGRIPTIDQNQPNPRKCCH